MPGMDDKLAEGARVVDLSCGAGYGLVRMAHHYPKCSLVGVDGDAYSLEIARERLDKGGIQGQIGLVHSSLEELGVVDEYDVVVNNISMHECRDIEKATANIYRSLKQGGYFVISDFPFPDATEDCRTVPARMGKVALISGGARGQGAAEATLFAREGAKVVIGDILDEEGEAVAAEIAISGGEARFVHLDVTREDEWSHAVDTAVSSFGKLNVLVNNAAIIFLGRVEDTTVEHWDRVLDVNAKGVFLGTKLAIPEMRKAGGGSIINVSSVAGLVGTPVTTAYPASKGAVRLLTKATAVQYGREGIRANTIFPGPVDTPMLRGVRPDEASREVSVATIILGRLGTPEDIAYGALYLASDESSFVTGSELVIDGGVTAQ